MRSMSPDLFLWHIHICFSLSTLALICLFIYPSIYQSIHISIYIATFLQDNTIYKELKDVGRQEL